MTNAYPDDNPKTAIGVTKVPLHLVPPAATHFMALALADGANKYGPYNWRDKAVSASTYIAAAKRHLDAWWDGENNSRDANVNHLAHAMASLAIVLDAMVVGKLKDDRPAAGRASDMQDDYANKNNKKEPLPDVRTEIQRRINDYYRRYKSGELQPVQLVSEFDPVEPRGLPNLQAYVRPPAERGCGCDRRMAGHNCSHTNCV